MWLICRASPASAGRLQINPLCFINATSQLASNMVYNKSTEAKQIQMNGASRRFFVILHNVPARKKLGNIIKHPADEKNSGISNQ